MNPEHYDKVRRALAEVAAAMDEMARIHEMVIGRRDDREGPWGPPGAETLELSCLHLSALYGSPRFSSIRSIWNETVGLLLSGGLDLADADLSGAWFVGAHLSDREHPASLTGALLGRTAWIGSQIAYADFTGANLRESILLLSSAKQCGGARFRNADLTRARIIIGARSDLAPGGDSRSSGDAVDFTDADLSHARVELDGVLPVVLAGANMAGCDCRMGPSWQSGAGTSADVMDRLHGGLLAEGQRVLGEQAALLDLQQISDAFEANLSTEQRAQLRARQKCFIATATCGSDDAGEVQRLRAFRDGILMPTSLGRACVHAYELISPPIARAVARSSVLRWAVSPDYS